MGPIPTIDLQDFTYELPAEKIALYPLEKRDESKLLKADVFKNEISHFSFKNLPDLLPENSLLIVNSTRVIHARIIMQKLTGGRAEVLCAEPLDEMVTLAWERLSRLKRRIFPSTRCTVKKYLSRGKQLRKFCSTF